MVEDRDVVLGCIEEMLEQGPEMLSALTDYFGAADEVARLSVLVRLEALAEVSSQDTEALDASFQVMMMEDEGLYPAIQAKLQEHRRRLAQ